MFDQTELGFRSSEQIISNEIEITSCFTSRSTIFKFQTKWASRAGVLLHFGLLLYTIHFFSSRLLFQIFENLKTNYIECRFL